ncbi:MAG: sprT domain-containing protein [Pseudomonadales bacterium]|nr:sprT domain-containing protein [Pseudomonadales bacterium]
MEKMAELKPTNETYSELQIAFAHFNLELFDSELPACLITLQRQKNTFGYLSPERFVNRGGKRADEIALNPSYFASRTPQDVMSTLVHEMVHLWQFTFGKPSRGRYHNKQWAEKMKSIGLHPSDTGEPGGKETGDQMTHYLIDGGPFHHSCNGLISDAFRLSWLDRFPEKVSGTIEPGLDEGQMERLGIVEPDENTGGSNSPSRTKFTCSGCSANAWGKASLNLVCGGCELPMEAE